MTSKRVGELAGRLARPPQRRLWIPTSIRVDQLVQGRQQPGSRSTSRLGPPPRRRIRPRGSGGSSSSRTPGVHRRSGQPTDRCHPCAPTTAERPSGRASQQAALLLGQVWGNQLVQPVQDAVHIHPGKLPARHTPTATIGQISHAGTLRLARGRHGHQLATVRSVPGDCLPHCRPAKGDRRLSP
jgi:hypothetical protein